ncbi:hypothetical protein [Bailinhaonella thermotolerans]|uniref:Uncharacterized protein n=1 Tax=Bailinhaonella thermotolerans TaxID=1070861 RepID=A0A3A4A9H1_9ACTN|nr:hypothetical protein [Bailinhaonella thermotolerans]RJL24781.1 hypothetical protein D5H75_28775 [Bailinhaonella thermotolerans]
MTWGEPEPYGGRGPRHPERCGTSRDRRTAAGHGPGAAGARDDSFAARPARPGTSPDRPAHCRTARMGALRRTT